MSDRAAIDWDELLATIEPSKAKADEARAGVADAMKGYADRIAQDVDAMLLPPVKKARKKKANHETKVQAKVMKYLGTVEGITELERTNAGKPPIPNGDGTFRYINVGKAGKSDIHFRRYGIRYVVEVKILEPRKTYASPSQKKYMIAEAAKGSICAVVRSVEDIIRVLECTDKGTVVQW